MRSLGRPVLGRGKEIASERINLKNCKRIDSDGPWVIKTRCKTQNYFNTQKQLRKPHRNMDRHLCHPHVSSRQQCADGEQLRLEPSEGLKWQPPKLLDGKKLNYSGCSLTATCRASLVFHISHHVMCAPFHMPSDASTAMRRHHDSGNTIKRGWKLKGKPARFYELCSFLRLLVHTKNTWLLWKTSERKRTGFVS